MDQSRQRFLQRVDEVFQEVADLPEAERPAALERLCGAEVELRRAVEELLAFATPVPDGRLAGTAAMRLAVEAILGGGTATDQRRLAPAPGGVTVETDDAERTPPGAEQGWMTAGMTIGKYELIRPLGHGGMGSVFLARHVELAQRVAIKSLLAQRAAAPEDGKRLLAEARTTARCRHENIVVIHDVGEHEGWPYLVLEYLEGQTLRQVLKASPGGLSPGRAIELMVPVVRALTAAHEQGIVHRDLKPENVMLTEAGVVKVLDFGIAQLPEAAARGRLAGTWPYMSPEQLAREDVDPRSDLWAVGILLHELVTGRHPLAPFSFAKIDQILDRGVPMPSVAETMPGLGPLGSIIDRCLLKQRELRPASARALLGELEPLLPGARAVALGEGESPFPGLAAFQEADTGRFFGRARDIAQMVGHVRRWPLLAIAGPSGAGKSSLVRAGVIPALKRSGEGWDALVIRPGPRPLAALAELLAHLPAVAGGAPAGGDGVPTETSQYRTYTETKRLRKEPGRLGAALRAHAGKRRRRVVVFVDQFEELYTLGAGAEDRAAFVACLASAADDPSSPVRVILTIRSDFLDRVLEDRAFAAELFRGIEPLAPIERDGLREALIEPLGAAHYRFETEALLDDLLDELAGTPSALPLLQFTASRLWEERDRTRRLLTAESCARIGGVAGALAEHADAVLAGMPDPDALLARAIFERLVTPQQTRAAATVDEVRELGDPAQIDRMLARLTEARLLSMEASAGEGAGSQAPATVELIHESLIEGWPTLRRWLLEDEGDRAFVARLRVAARQWEAGGHSDDLLWRGQAARDARRWLARREAAGAAHRRAHELGEREERMLHATVRRANRTRRRLRIALAAVLGVLVGFAGILAYLTVRARDEAARADAATGEASTEAARARDAGRMTAARELRADPTTMLALLREIELPEPPQGWSALTRWAFDAGVADAVLVHPVVPSSVAYRPDGRQIVTGCADGAVRVWNADGSSEPMILRGHDGVVLSVTYSPDGRRIASSSKDLTVRVWNADGSGQPLVLRGHQAQVSSVAFSPDGKRIVSAAFDREARVWHADGSGEPVVLRHPGLGMYTARFSPDGTRIVTASADGAARVWNSDGSGTPLVLEGHGSIVSSAVFSPDGRRIVTTSADATVRVWSGDRYGSSQTLRGHRHLVLSAAFSPDGSLIATGGMEGVLIWSSDDLRLLAVLRHFWAYEAEGVTSVAFSPDGRRLAAAAGDDLARVWDLGRLRRPSVLHGHEGTSWSAVFSRDGAQILSAASDDTARIWSADNSVPPVILRHGASLYHAEWSPDGSRIITAGKDGIARVWRADGTGNPLFELRGHLLGVTHAAFSPDGSRIVTAGQDATVRLWSPDGAGAALVLSGHRDIVMSAAFDPGGARIVTASHDTTARVWSADGSGQPVVLRGHLDVLHSAAFSPDGTRVVTGSKDRTARIWNADGSGEPVILRHADYVGNVAFSPDGSRVATSTRDELRIWNADGSGTPVLLLASTVVTKIAFSPDGSQIVAGQGNAGPIQIWRDLRPIALDDPRLWTATDYCPPVAKRQQLLGVTEARARADLAACERRVRAARGR